MIHICRHYYYNVKELKLNGQFQCEYRVENAIRSYSKQPFVYKLLNKTSKDVDIDLLHTFRLFIDIPSESLAREQILTVYQRAQSDQV